MVTIDARQNEVTLVQCFGTLRAGTNAHRRERMLHTGEEAAFLRQGATIGHHAESVHLQTIVVMEAQRLVLNNTLVQLEAALLQTLATARMA